MQLYSLHPSSSKRRSQLQISISPNPEGPGTVIANGDRRERAYGQQRLNKEEQCHPKPGPWKRWDGKDREEEEEKGRKKQLSSICHLEVDEKP